MLPGGLATKLPVPADDVPLSFGLTVAGLQTERRQGLLLLLLVRVRGNGKEGRGEARLTSL